MDYLVIKKHKEIPKVYIEWIDGCQVEAVQSESGEVYYLSMSFDLQEAGYKRVETGKVMHVDYCGERKLVSLCKLEKVN